MKRTFAALLVIATALHSLPAPARAWTAIEKIGGEAPVTVLVREKPRVYFRVTPSAPITVTIEGPARVRIVSRVELPQGSNAVTTYRLDATAGGHVIESLDTETTAADNVQLATGGPPLGKSRRMTFDVPAGSHRISLSLHGAPAALVRIQHATPKSDAPMVSLTPLHASRSVVLNEGQKLITYHTTRTGQPVSLRVVGPTTLELLTRLDYDVTMRGSQSYRMRVSEPGHPPKTFDFKTTKAVAAVYTNLPDRVPSKFSRVRISVPAGTHEYAVELVQPAAGSAEVHARIPAPSVGNEE